MSQPSNPYDSPPPAPRGMSGATKVLLGIGIGVGVLGLLCCGGLGLGGFMLVRFFQDSLSTDPARAEQIVDQIAQIEIPETLEPKASMEMRIPFTDKVFLTWAAYNDAAEDSGLWIAQFGEDFGNPEQMQREFRRSLEEKGQGRSEDLKITDTENYDAEINGEKAHFTIETGIEESSQDEYIQVAGQFRGKGGPAMLLMRVRSPQFSKDGVMAIIKSIK